MSLIKYLLITMALVFSLATGFLVVSQWPGWGSGVILVLLLVGIIRCTSVIQVYYTPVVRRVLARKQLVSNGRKIESVIEEAALNSGRLYIPTYVIRHSIYDTQTKRRLHRSLLGDTVDYLGEYNDVFWFDVTDKFYSWKNGLIGKDCRTGLGVVHFPKKDFTIISDRADLPEVRLQQSDGTHRQLRLDDASVLHRTN